ncbi:MAG: bifunctional riboflavin kinase/FAD synthetase [Sulfurovum sp.]|nr:bifunctional riboflavin kinase/FAD synthetase [Sulfurovum sp.]
MKINNSIKSIAIGSFDGIHIAHQALIERAEAVVVIERNGGYLTPGYKRTLYTDNPCYFYHFDKIRRLSPEAFVAKLETDFPHLEKIVVGYDFSFGKARAGNTKLLTELFEKEVEIVPEICYEKIPVHSRTIKAYLQEGEVEMANRLLGRNYRIDGTVIRGQGLGAKELVPTLNLKVRNYQLPKEGVYATKTLIEGQWLESVSFVGHRVTTDGSFAVETHIIDRTITYTSFEEIWVAFHALIRPNQKFNSLDALRIQIVKDIKTAATLLR